MIDHGPARECEMVLAFLRGEVGTDRWNAHTTIAFSQLQQPELTPQVLIENANLENETHNAARRNVLASYRGYGRNDLLFRGFPSNVTWRRVELEPQDLKRLRYCAEANWMKFSHGTRNPAVVAQRIKDGELADDPAPRVNAIQRKVRCGQKLPALILAEGADGQLILIEGHSRATAYLGMSWNGNISALIASSSIMKEWSFY